MIIRWQYMHIYYLLNIDALLSTTKFCRKNFHTFPTKYSKIWKAETTKIACQLSVVKIYWNQDHDHWSLTSGQDQDNNIVYEN